MPEFYFTSCELGVNVHLCRKQMPETCCLGNFKPRIVLSIRFHLCKMQAYPYLSQFVWNFSTVRD